MQQDGEILEKEALQEMLLKAVPQESAEKLQEQGELELVFAEKGQYRIRANIYRQQSGLAAALRILPDRIPSPEELEIPAVAAELLREKKGLVLITGEDGSGKSTVLASLLAKQLEHASRHLITIENPVEYQIPEGKGLVSQREIGRDTGSFAAALKAARRQDADVIACAELNDMETVTEALCAARAGSLVISCMDTGSAEDTVHHLISMFPEQKRAQIRLQLSDVLKGIITRQLVPGEVEEKQCAAYEIMKMNPEIRRLLQEGRTAHLTETIAAYGKEGMQTLDASLLSLYMKSRISEETAVGYARDTQLMQKRITIY